MKELLKIQGGYPRQMDYLINMQNELFMMNNSMLAGLGIDLALSGCEVTDHGNGTLSIAAGVVYISGEVLRFDGASNLSDYATKTLVKGAFVASDPKIFADQQSKNVYREAKAIVGARSSMLQLQIKNTNLYNIKDYISDTIAAVDVKGAIRQIYDFDGTFMASFDASGLGITPRWDGWALMNGNNGTKDAQGRSLIGVGRYFDSVTGLQTNYTIGELGGEKTHKLTVAEMPNHDHTMESGSVSSGGAGAYQGYNGGGSGGARTRPSGGGQPHNNMQPYLAVYIVVKIR
ncbi:MAG: hypothetical protein P0Y49_15345 [Candidatus Pedobacter colombiensis]|uniref:Baseplate structural protein Gp10 C-terminal domain-containing protein n=1 Tax=Candidatus Pedobacter colombiensis TaxID=3121371 RepID=A0AAJ6B5H2_9SPHI|nr:hypothetical protein [Pedobacter sp.]WEK18165.1 MAG: hypothetical protein P0Y49_15345 [Pedobacter sp.]